MKNVIAVIVLGLFVIFSGSASAVEFTENLSCGEAFSADGWAAGYDFAFEIQKKNKGYKVKTLAKVGSQMIHLECARNLESPAAALAWLKDHGYTFRDDGAEYGGASGRHKTVNRGPLTAIPEHLYK